MSEKEMLLNICSWHRWKLERSNVEITEKEVRRPGRYFVEHSRHRQMEAGEIVFFKE